MSIHIIFVYIGMFVIAIALIQIEWFDWAAAPLCSPNQPIDRQTARSLIRPPARLILSSQQSRFLSISFFCYPLSPPLPPPPSPLHSHRRAVDAIECKV